MLLAGRAIISFFEIGRFYRVKNKRRWRQQVYSAEFFNDICHVWTAPSWQELSSRLQEPWSVQPCVRPVSAAHGPLAIMPSADQVPVKSTHSTMRWHKWVVLIAGSAGTALRAVRPFQPSHHAG
jgi:hypothetical protein